MPDPIPVKYKVLDVFVADVIPTNVPVEPSPTFTVAIPIRSLEIFATYTEELSDIVVVPIPVKEATKGFPLFVE